MRFEVNIAVVLTVTVLRQRPDNHRSSRRSGASADRLPEQQRKIVVLRYYADQSEVAVAEALGISVGSVKSAASRGLAALRQHAEAQAQAEAEAEEEAQAQARNVTSPTEGSLR